MPIRVVIADDHGVLRGGLRSLLNAEPDLEVVGEAADGDQAMMAVDKLQPDVLVADISMPGPSGIEMARDLKQRAPGTRVLILTMHQDAGLLQEALRAGAAGFVAKRAAESELIDAVRAVRRGEVYVDSTMRQVLASHQVDEQAGTEELLQSLSPEELEVLRRLARGMTVAQVMAELGIGLAAFDRARASLGQKLGLHTRIQMIHFAREHGLLDS